MSKVIYTKELMEEACTNAYSIAQVCRNIGLKPLGSNYKTVRKKIAEFEIDITHFTGQRWNKGKAKTEETSLIPLTDILKENTNYRGYDLRNRLVKKGLKENKCEICGYDQNLELHHINGNHYDNRLENLQILCPNCHAKTYNYKGRNSNRKEEPANLYKKSREEHYCTCKNCNKIFYSDRIDRTRKFCSRECYNDYLNKLRTGEVSETLQEGTNIQNVQKLTKENLLKEIPNHNNMTSLATVFSVSRTTIRNYLEKYDLLNEFKSKYDFHSLSVFQLDLQRNIIKEWPSITDAADSLNIDTSTISAVCKGKRRSAGGYYWKYKE